MPKTNKIQSSTVLQMKLKGKQILGHSPIIKPKAVESSLGGLPSGIIPSLLTSSTSRICSHQ